MKRMPMPVIAGAVLSLLACARGSHDEKAEPPEQPAVRPGFGTVMADVARRYELVGRASAAGRFELAEYELDEISELFTDELPYAAPPREGHPEVLPAMTAAFLKTSLAGMKSALEARDRTKAAAAFERTATACNACHVASGHGFIEVPLVASRSIPNTDPVTP